MRVIDTIRRPPPRIEQFRSFLEPDEPGRAAAVGRVLGRFEPPIPCSLLVTDRAILIAIETRRRTGRIKLCLGDLAYLEVSDRSPEKNVYEVWSMVISGRRGLMIAVENTKRGADFIATLRQLVQNVRPDLLRGANYSDAGLDEARLLEPSDLWAI
jgi:hypothetical protein